MTDFCLAAEPLGNQPLKLTSHKQIDNEAAQRKTEESSERHSGALLGGYREVSAHLLYCSFLLDCFALLVRMLCARSSLLFGFANTAGEQYHVL